MENCIYGGKERCTFDLKDKHGYYYNDLVIEWKMAANKGELRCIDCGQPVYLAAGPIKEPYFAHYDKQACPYGNHIESEESKKGKRLLYTLLKNSFPEGDIRARYRMGNGMYATCYVINPNGQDIAIDYRLQYSGIENFHMRDTYYKENNIIPIYLLGSNKNRPTNQLSWYDNLIQKAIGYCGYLDVIKEQILLKKSFDYTVGMRRKIKYLEKKYSLEELRINEKGDFEGDFQELCNELEKSIEKDKKEYEQNQLRVSQTAKNFYLEGSNGIRADILKSALEYLRRNEGYLVARKYLDYIAEHNLFEASGEETEKRNE